ncbi:MAG TPA: hypothetical protein PK736_05410 [Bacteroidia bacterium]|nr:hypothetical protein [Bacteroidia bacterium]
MKNFNSKISFILIIACMLFACNKDTFTPVEVTYLVLVKPGNTVTINCYNDYYFDTEKLKPILHTGEGLYFRSSHIAYKEEDYYINVAYTDSTKSAEDNYLVWVKFNDSTVTKLSYKYAKPNIEIKGRVTEL